jgi:N-acetylglutamate synthase-like GNAT family acetyltransferase
MQDYSGGLVEGIKYYHSKWGNQSNYSFFFDAISHSTNSQSGLPRFYLLIKNEKIIGCCGLIINDFISRHDLYPWLAGVFIEENERGQGLGNIMMKYAENEAKNAGYSVIYLTTKLDGFYEKYGWKRTDDGFEQSGESAKIYMKEL